MSDERCSDPEGLTRLRVAGLGSLADVELRPGRLTVLIGPNGSGKSNILRALAMLPLMRRGSLQKFVGEAGGASSLLHRGPKRTSKIDLEVEFREGEATSFYSARLGFAGGEKLVYLDEWVESRPGPLERHEVHFGTGHLESPLRDVAIFKPAAAALDSWLRNLSFFHFHDTSFRSALRTSANAAEDRSLQSDGDNLAAFLLRLQTSKDEDEKKAWLRIRDYVRRVVPAIKELVPTPFADGTVVRLDWIDDQDERFFVDQLSDGSLRAIALITALAQPTKTLPRFISIDEPELGLHPAAMALIAELARSISHRTQVLFATQSMEFLDYFDPEEVIVVERKAGATRLRRLDPEDLKEWLKEYSLSEIYDKGVIGGRP